MDYLTLLQLIIFRINIIIIIIIITSSFYSSEKHRAPVKFRHLVLFVAKAFTSVQLFFPGFN
jgi:hypothetical protein